MQRFSGQYVWGGLRKIGGKKSSIQKEDRKLRLFEGANLFGGYFVYNFVYNFPHQSFLLVQSKSVVHLSSLSRKADNNLEKKIIFRRKNYIFSIFCWDL